MTFNWLKLLHGRRQKKNFLLTLLGEVNRNLERYYVIEQRQFVAEPFETQAFREAQEYGGIEFPVSLLEYAQSIEGFNQLLKDARDFESIYSSSIENKTRANAEILHAKKEEVENRLTTLRPLIARAHNEVRDLLGP